MKRSAERVLFRVDAGADVGLGHLHRCMALAHALRQRSMMCAFILCGDESSVRHVAASGYRVDLAAKVPPGGAEDLDLVLKAADDYETNAIVIDSYHMTAKYLVCLREAGLRVIVVDDLAQFSFPCEIVINFGVAATQLPYASLTGNTIFLLGPRYTLLPPEFFQERPRHIHDNVDKILVTLGGADHNNLMPRILRSVDESAGDFDIAAVIGPYFTNADEVESTAANLRHQVTLVRNPESILRLMVRSDVAISAGGQTLYELAATGTPTVAIQVAENQARNIEAFAREGTLRFVGVAKEAIKLPDLRDALVTLINSGEQRRKMSAAGQRLLDGKGAERVAKTIQSSLGAI